jgi:hypothetical protein
MSRHDDSVRLRHMLDAARSAVSLVAGKSRSEVATDELAQLALARLLEHPLFRPLDSTQFHVRSTFASPLEPPEPLPRVTIPTLSGCARVPRGRLRGRRDVLPN